MRGGVSLYALLILTNEESSPHAWGCFFLFLKVMATGLVFPTCVGVFLNYTGLIWLDASLPHMRGGVSVTHSLSCFIRTSSPHAWGCFQMSTVTLLLLAVFPTCVGVFPLFYCQKTFPSRLPHMRGGVSDYAIITIAFRVSSPHAWGCF